MSVEIFVCLGLEVVVFLGCIEKNLGFFKVESFKRSFLIDDV